MELYSVSAANFCSYSKLQLPLYKQGMIWVGGINNDTAAADSNGSGKSTIFKAITWGLYGDTIDGEKCDKVIKDGEKKAVVKIELLDGDGSKWTITRTRSKGAPGLAFETPHGLEVSGDKNQIQDKILEAIGLDFRAFKNTVLYGQGDSSRFAHPNTKDAERKIMLHKIMRTDMLALCHELVKGECKRMEGDIQEARLECEKLKTAKDSVDLPSLELEYSNWEKERQDDIDSRMRNIKEYKKQALSLIQRADEHVIETPNVAVIEAEIDAMQAEADAIDVDECAIDIKENELGALESDLASKERKAASLEASYNAQNDKISELEGDNCPVCTSSLKTGSANKYIASVRKEMKRIKALMDVNSAEISTLESSINDLTTDIANMKRLTSDRDRLIRAVVKKRSGELYEAQMEAIRSSKKADDLKREAAIAITSAKNELKEINKAKGRANPYGQKLKEAKAKYIQLKERISVAEKGLKTKRRELAHWKFWSKGFSNQGLPSYVLDSIMPFITDRANHYLELLTDGDITVEFKTQRELKSAKGAMRDEIEISWEIEGVDDHPPSGGQMKKIEIATDLALMDLVARREGGKLDIMMMDEVLDGLDAEGCSRVVDLLRRLRKDRGSIFVVSHESKVGESFERAIWAVKEDGTTSLEVA
jgi:DNA repair exonuclease SbcCD ATPase subunit